MLVRFRGNAAKCLKCEKITRLKAQTAAAEAVPEAES